MLNGSKITALVAAGGLGVRMKLDIAKPLLLVRNKPVVIYTLEVLEAHPLIDEIVLVFNKDGLDDAKEAVKRYNISKVARVVAGGATRKDSVASGLGAVDSATRLVVIHDGVRPFVDECAITRVIEAAENSGAAVLGVPVKSTIKHVDKNLDIELTLKRDSLWEIQTPQVFDRELIQAAYARSGGDFVSDDASLVELMGKKVRVVTGSYFNIKITTQEDLAFAEAIVAARTAG